MKNYLLLLVLLFGITVFAQDSNTTFKRNEIKGNALFLVLGSFEVTYERIINEESGFGVSLHVPISNEFDLNYSITPYYRYYFGKKPAAGFFMEGFGMLNSVNDYVYVYDPNDNSGYKDITDFAFGIGIGGKWVTKKGILLEINSGVGRNLFSSYNDTRDFEFVGRGGITVGYRF